MRNILIFGDSYSTFKGHIPNGYATYYPSLDVQNVEQTWWNRVVRLINGNLIHNNSWSGSTICYTGYNNSDCSKSNSFIYRYRTLKEEGFFDKNNIDTIFVFGGTNDSWADVPLGEVKFSDWKEKDLFMVFPAIANFVSGVKADFPNADIIVIINSDIKEEIQNTMEEIAKYFDVKFIRLSYIDKESGHPTAKGMEMIAEEVLRSLEV